MAPPNPCAAPAQPAPSFKRQHLDPNAGTGWDIAALSDSDPEYAGSCGRCYEGARAHTLTRHACLSALAMRSCWWSRAPPDMQAGAVGCMQRLSNASALSHHSLPVVPCTAPPRDQPSSVSCVNADVKDGYGAEVSRSGSCHDTSKTVKVTITDTCECPPLRHGMAAAGHAAHTSFAAHTGRAHDTSKCVSEAALLCTMCVCLAAGGSPPLLPLPAGPCYYPSNQYSNKRWALAVV